ncbi:MAG: Acetyltransferase (GNAT) family protein [Candidatus Izimaplasma bacterium HR2]|nr:MAG: Acetyltransferase (GNAT) family protein [Candidatus Izimaplasma bacterium HR2]
MKIVEYNNKLAAQVAEMWNKSGSNWGNDDSVKTAEDVILEESKSGNLKLYLAIDNDEVIGYCSFSEYEHDEGASYLPLLNVRPDYHGKKVGKALILRVLEDAINAPWPRFDLFTWSGNIKAMPLYKKCGFFWEKNNEAVHLMNFIPFLHQTEAISEHLKLLDWYKDSKRAIEMKQDGTLVNGFDHFRYHFENDQTLLITEFEKTGRGLRYLETSDYSIEMILPKHQLVYNQSYDVTFKVVNKSNKKLEITLEGVSNKNIISDFKDTFTVEEVYTVKKQFTVNKTSKIQDKFKTHPLVACNIHINGKKSIFKCGVEPKNPVSLKLELPEYNHVLGTIYTGYLDIESNLSIEATLTIALPKKHISVLNKLEVTMKPEEKRSLKIEYKLKECGFIHGDASITYEGRTIQSEVKSLVKGQYNTFHGEDEHNVYLVDGNYTIRYDKTHNRISYINEFTSNGQTAFMTPRIGLPYTKDLSNQKAVFTYPKENILKASLQSKSFKDVTLSIYMESNRGILNTSFELVNNGDKKELDLSLPIWKVFKDTCVPYNGGILETTISEGGGATSLDSKLIDENWLYDRKTKTGFSWHKDNQLIVSGWRFASVIEGIILEKGSTYKSKDFIISFVHPNLRLFRRFAGNLEEKETLKFITLNINNGNPFVKGNTTLLLKNIQKKEMKGTISCDEKSVVVEEALELSPGLKNITLETKDRIIEYKRLIFDVNGTVECIEKEESLIVQNGLLEYKVSNAYSDAVYSLKFNGNEWLDSNYPTPKDRMWWGTFVGGINQSYESVQNEVIINEPRKAAFITLQDTLGNNWQGIKTTVSFEKEKDFKGIVFENYHLTLPGVPVLYTFSNIINKAGKFINHKFFTRYNVLQLDDDNKKASFTLDGTTYKCGSVGIEKETKKFVQFKSTRDCQLGIYNKNNLLLPDTQEQYTILFSEQKMSIADRSTKQLSGDFYIFTKEDLRKEYLIDLENIKFEV